MLLKVPGEIFKDFNKRYKKVEITKEDDSIGLKDINKGMGIIKC